MSSTSLDYVFSLSVIVRFKDLLIQMVVWARHEESFSFPYLLFNYRTFNVYFKVIINLKYHYNLIMFRFVQKLREKYRNKPIVKCSRHKIKLIVVLLFFWRYLTRGWFYISQSSIWPSKMVLLLFYILIFLFQYFTLDFHLEGSDTISYKLPPLRPWSQTPWTRSGVTFYVYQS